jgi:hypothetical protein
VRLIHVFFPDAIYWELRGSAPQVNEPVEGLDSDNAEDYEEEEHEYESVGELGERPQHDGHQSSHTWQPLDRSQWPDDPERSQIVELGYVISIQYANDDFEDAGEHNYEVHDVPAISKVRVLVRYQTLSDYFHGGFEDEKIRGVVHNVVENLLGFLSALGLQGIVDLAVHGLADRSQADKEYDEAIKILPLSEPHYHFSEFGVIFEKV